MHAQVDCSGRRPWDGVEYIYPVQDPHRPHHQQSELVTLHVVDPHHQQSELVTLHVVDPHHNPSLR